MTPETVLVAPPIKFLTFFFKNCNRNFIFVFRCKASRWPGLLRCCTLRLCAHSEIVCATVCFSCWGTFYLWFSFLFDFNAACFRVVITKLVISFFLQLYFCIFWHVVISVVRNCLFVFLPLLLLFDIICVFAYLPYFLQWFCALLNCFLQAYHSCLQLFDVCRLLSVPLPRFGQFAFILDLFFLWYKLCLTYIALTSICLTLLLRFCCCFLARFVIAYFAL